MCVDQINIYNISTSLFVTELWRTAFQAELHVNVFVHVEDKFPFTHNNNTSAAITALVLHHVNYVTHSKKYFSVSSTKELLENVAVAFITQIHFTIDTLLSDFHFFTLA